MAGRYISVVISHLLMELPTQNQLDILLVIAAGRLRATLVSLLLNHKPAKVSMR